MAGMWLRRRRPGVMHLAPIHERWAERRFDGDVYEWRTECGERILMHAADDQDRRGTAAKLACPACKRCIRSVRRRIAYLTAVLAEIGETP